MKKIWIFCLVLYVAAINTKISAQEITLDYYLPTNVTYNPDIPTPESVIGHQVGEWHVSHDKLVQYMQVLAEASDRIHIEQHGLTHEKRPLLLLSISTPENLARAEDIKEQRQNLTHPERGREVSLENMPTVIYMGFSIHGNEPSGSNASMLTAYYLAAAQGEAIESRLSNVVILLDPSFNPDGLNRFASWVNSHKSKNLVTDPQSREFSEAWPRGRTNHYWFDLNRDWLPAQHPESQARLRKFHEWKPNILTDHHEMGTNSTFFFQPGIPSRNNPLTPENNYVLTEAIARYHAEELDKIGSLYFTQENYDDYYYGKGSTYPDVNGAVGILFEQASSRGHAQESDHGVLTFPFTIRNQFITTLSTIRAADEMRERLLNHQRDFYRNNLREAAGDNTKAYIFGHPKDQARAYHLAEMILRHDISLYRPSGEITIEGQQYTPTNSYIVPLEQPQYRLIKAMFERRTTFEDSLFYDVSAWTLPLAFNMPHAQLSKRALKGALGEQISTISFPQGGVLGGKSNYAYLFEWHAYYAPRALNRLLNAGIRAKVSTEAFGSGEKSFDRGTILVNVQNQEKTPDEIHEIMQEIAREDGLYVYNASSGYSRGINLGSPSFSRLEQPKPAMLVEDGVSSYDAGEIWHLLDQRYDMPLSMLPVSSLGRADLSRYNTLIMVDGNYGNISKAAQDKLKSWVRQGGTIVAMQRAGKWLSGNEFTNVRYKRSNQADSIGRRPYATLSDTRGAQLIAGAIFEAQLDLTHPLAFGYTNEQISLFRNSQDFMHVSGSGYANPVVYTNQPLQAGYISAPRLEELRNTAAIQVSGMGSGKIITFTDNPNFRAFWYGTNKLFMNSLFFGPIISGRSAD